MSWKQYRTLNQHRSVRPLFLELMKFVQPSQGQLVIDLGSGAGVEAREFLARGWSVLAIDSDAEGIEALGSDSRLRTECRTFEEIQALPECAVIFSSMSLTFCSREAFPRFWGTIVNALHPKSCKRSLRCSM